MFTSSKQKAPPPPPPNVKDIPISQGESWERLLCAAALLWPKLRVQPGGPVYGKNKEHTIKLRHYGDIVQKNRVSRWILNKYRYFTVFRTLSIPNDIYRYSWFFSSWPLEEGYAAAYTTPKVWRVVRGLGRLIRFGLGRNRIADRGGLWDWTAGGYMWGNRLYNSQDKKNIRTDLFYAVISRKNQEAHFSSAWESKDLCAHAKSGGSDIALEGRVRWRPGCAADAGGQRAKEGWERPGEGEICRLAEASGSGDFLDSWTDRTTQGIWLGVVSLWFNDVSMKFGCEGERAETCREKLSWGGLRELYQGVK